MNNKEIMEALFDTYNLIYGDTKSIQTGLYTAERAELEKKIEEIRGQCSHTLDSNGETAVEDGYCIICGKKIN